MFNRHKHNWDLIDKEVIPPHNGSVETGAGGRYTERAFIEREITLRRAGMGYVVLTFKCQCGDIRIEER